MALKRTQVPFYGKKNQRLEKLADVLARQGHFDQAAELVDKSKEIIRKKRGERLVVLI